MAHVKKISFHLLILTVMSTFVAHAEPTISLDRARMGTAGVGLVTGGLALWRDYKGNFVAGGYHRRKLSPARVYPENPFKQFFYYNWLRGVVGLAVVGTTYYAHRILDDITPYGKYQRAHKTIAEVAFDNRANVHLIAIAQDHLADSNKLVEELHNFCVGTSYPLITALDKLNFIHTTIAYPLQLLFEAEKRLADDVRVDHVEFSAFVSRITQLETDLKNAMVIIKQSDAYKKQYELYEQERQLREQECLTWKLADAQTQMAIAQQQSADAQARLANTAHLNTTVNTVHTAMNALRPQVSVPVVNAVFN